MNLKRARSNGTLCLVVAVLAFSLIPLTSLADAQGGESEANREAAREYYKQGKAFYDAGKFEEAKREFEAAYNAQPHPVVLKSIAECKAAIGDILGAIETLEKFLSDPKSKGKPEIEARMVKLKGMLVPLDVASDPPGAAISIDGEDKDETTPATFKLNPGEYQVTLTLEGYAPINKTTNLKIGSVSGLSVDFSIEGVAAAPVAEDSSSDETSDSEADEIDDDDKDGLPTGFWISAAVTGVGLVSGVVFGAMALSAQSDFDEEQTQAKADSGKIKAALADVSFGVAAAAAVTGTIILIANRKKETDDTTAKVGIVPVAGHKTFGMNAIVEF